MRRLLLVTLRLWNRAANSGLIVALLDLLLLALACYLGYAIRLSLFIPALYARDCIVTAIAFPALASAIFTVFGQYKILWTQASLEDYVRFSELYLLASLLFVLVNGVWRLVLLPRKIGRAHV